MTIVIIAILVLVMLHTISLPDNPNAALPHQGRKLPWTLFK